MHSKYSARFREHWPWINALDPLDGVEGGFRDEGRWWECWLQRRRSGWFWNQDEAPICPRQCWSHAFVTASCHYIALGFTEKSSIWPRLLVGYIAANGWLVTASHMWHQKEKGYSPLPETFPGEKLQHTSVNISDLKILQVFFKNRREILVL